MAGAYLKRVCLAAADWATDKLLESWPAIATFLVSGGAMTYASSVSAWLRPWGTVAFLGIGLVSGVAVAVGLTSAYSILTKARIQSANAEFLRERSRTNNINTLAPEHVRE